MSGRTVLIIFALLLSSCQDALKKIDGAWENSQMTSGQSVVEQSSFCQALNSEVRPLLLANCSACHGDLGIQQPMHSVSDPIQACQTIQQNNLIDLESPVNSHLHVKASLVGHCPGCGSNLGDQMLAAIQALPVNSPPEGPPPVGSTTPEWTPPVPTPLPPLQGGLIVSLVLPTTMGVMSTLSSNPSSWTSISIDLSVLGSSYTGLRFRLEVAEHGDEYVFQNPTLQLMGSPPMQAHIRGIRVTVKNTATFVASDFEFETTWSQIDRFVRVDSGANGRDLATTRHLAMRTSGPNRYLGVRIEDLSLTTNPLPPCSPQALSRFVSVTQPMIASNCNSCHFGPPSNFMNQPSQFLNTNQTPENLCRDLRQYMALGENENIASSPLASLPASNNTNTGFPELNHHAQTAAGQQIAPSPSTNGPLLSELIFFTLLNSP